jgi:hydrogenase maturation protein HypF
LGVQHHHAHVAACLAEHGRLGPALGVAFDGTGFGSDGQIWGGEWLEADLGSFVRRGHLRPLALPGGEAAIRQPWRLAMAALADAGEPLDLLAQVPPLQRQQVGWLLGAPGLARASAAGRWFDAVAILCGLGLESSYEGQAPCELEALAAPGEHGTYPFTIEADAQGGPFVVDLRPTIAAIAAERRHDRPAALIAARFHDTLAEVIRQGCRLLRDAGGPTLVALGGGCFANRRLAERTLLLLERDGFEVLLPARVPAGDGGLALGQAAIASFRRTVSAELERPCA